MSREYVSALSRLRAELDRQSPSPIQVMKLFDVIERFGDANELSWQDLQRLNVIDIIGDGIIHLRGWPRGMVADEQERACLLDAFRGDDVTNGLLQQLLRRFPSDVRNRYLDLYGDLVRGGDWSNSDVEVYDTDEGSYHGDSVQEAAHYHQQFVETAEADNRSMIARTKFAHLVQFLLGSEGGTTTLEAFRAHLQLEGNAGRYPFPVLPVGAHEELLDP